MNIMKNILKASERSERELCFYRAQFEGCVDVGLIFFYLFPESHCLVVLTWIDVLIEVTWRKNDDK